MSKVSAERIISSLAWSRGLQNATKIFLDSKLQPKQANDALRILRSSKNATAEFYRSYMLYFAALGNTNQVQEGAKLAEEDAIRLNTNQILIYALCKSGQTDAAYDLLQKEVARGAAPTLPLAYSNLVNNLVRAGRIHEANEVLELSHVHDAALNSSYHYLTGYYKKKNNLTSAFRIYGQLKARGLKPDSYVICDLLSMLDHNDPRVSALFDDMRKFGIAETVAIHNAIMSNEGRTGDVEAVRARFAAMAAQRLEPDMVSFLALLSAYQQRRDPAGALAVLDEIRAAGLRPTHDCYEKVSSAMVRAGDLESSQKLLERMAAEGIQVTEYFLTCIMDAQGNQPEWVKEALRKHGFASAQGGTTELQVFVMAHKDINRALIMYRQIRAEGVVPSERLAVLLIHKLRNMGRAAECKEVFLDVESAGVVLDVKIYNLVLSLLSSTKDVETCTRILSKMKEKGPVPNGFTYQALALGFTHAGLEMLALSVLRAAQVAGVPVRGVYKELVHGMASTHNFDQMLSVLTEMCTQGLAGAKQFADAIRFHVKNKAVCLQLFELMQKHNVRCDAQVYKLLIRMARNAEDPALAFDFAARMRAEHLAFDAGVYTELVALAASRNDFNMCEQLIERMYCDGAECAPTAATYHNVIMVMLRKVSPEYDRVQNMVDDMLAHGIVPSASEQEDTLLLILEGYLGAGLYTLAWEVYERVRSMKGVLSPRGCSTLIKECMWRGDIARCDALLDAEETTAREGDFANRIFGKPADRGGCDAFACARVYSRLRAMGVEVNETTRKFIARIYTQHEEDEGRGGVGLERVDSKTLALLEKLPELQTQTTKERLEMRLNLERDIDLQIVNQTLPESTPETQQQQQERPTETQARTEVQQPTRQIEQIETKQTRREPVHAENATNYVERLRTLEQQKQMEERKQKIQNETREMEEEIEQMEEEKKLLQEETNQVEDKKQLEYEKRQLEQQKQQIEEERKLLKEAKKQMIKERKKLLEEKKKLIEQEKKKVKERKKHIEEEKQLMEEEKKQIEEERGELERLAKYKEDTTERERPEGKDPQNLILDAFNKAGT